MELSQQLPDYYQRQRAIDGLPTLTTPDAIHLATAIYYGASEFHTFDERDEPRRRRALLPLSGNVAGYPLVIIKPPVPNQTPIFSLGKGSPNISLPSAEKPPLLPLTGRRRIWRDDE
jgi:hypothetical protein